MKTQSLLILILLIFVTSCESSQEAPDFQLGAVEMNGSGCRDSLVVLNDEGTGVVVEFENFQVQAGGLYSKLQRKNCSLAVPLDVPKGYQVAIVPGTLKGQIDLKNKSSLKVNLNTFIAGERGVTSKVSFTDPELREFKIGGYEDLNSIKFSKCGESIILRVNMSLFIKSKNTEDQSFASLNGFEGENKEAFSLIWKECI